MVIWLNGTLGAGKSAVGQALATILPGATYVDGDDHAGPPRLPLAIRWHMALDALLHLIARPGRNRSLVVAYPLRGPDYARLRVTCNRARRTLIVVNLAPPLMMTLQCRGARELDAGERVRVRAMRSEGYHRRRFAAFTLPNAQQPAARTAWLLARRVHRTRAGKRGNLLGHPRQFSRELSASGETVAPFAEAFHRER